LPIGHVAEQDRQAIGNANAASQAAMAGDATVCIKVVWGLRFQGQQARAVYLLKHHRSRTQRLCQPL
jgi:hypothetical protein